MLKKTFKAFGVAAFATAWAFGLFCLAMGEAWTAALRDAVLAAWGLA